MRDILKLALVPKCVRIHTLGFDSNTGKKVSLKNVVMMINKLNQMATMQHPHSFTLMGDDRSS